MRLHYYLCNSTRLCVICIRNTICKMMHFMQRPNDILLSKIYLYCTQCSELVKICAALSGIEYRYFVWGKYVHHSYRQTSIISSNLVGNRIVDQSDVVGASPVAWDLAVFFIWPKRITYLFLCCLRQRRKRKCPGRPNSRDYSKSRYSECHMCTWEIIFLTVRWLNCVGSVENRRRFAEY